MLSKQMKRNNGIGLFLSKLLIVAIGALFVIGCGEGDSGPVRIGTNVWPGYEPIYLARDLEYFGEDEVSLDRYPSATKVIQAFRDHSIDVAALTLDEALDLARQGVDLRVFFVTDVSNGDDVIMALTGSGIDGVEDLEGRIIGVESNVLGAYMQVRALQLHNVPIESVETLYVTANDAQKYLFNREVDAVILFEPYRTRMLQLGAKEIFSSREIPNEIFDVLVTHASYAEDNADRLQKLVRDWEKAIGFLTDQPEQASALIASRFQMQAEDVSSTYDGLIIPDNASVRRYLKGGNSSPLAETAKELSKILHDSGVWETFPPTEGIFTDAFLN